MTHPSYAPKGPFIFGDVGDYTLSICTSIRWTKQNVETFANRKRPGYPGWQAVNKFKIGLGFGEATPSPCNHDGANRQHWFLMRLTPEEAAPLWP